MKRNAWGRLAAVSCGVALVVAACTVNSTNEPGDGGNAGGTSGSGTGGTSGSGTGGTATGGTAGTGTGGAAGGGAMCLPTDGGQTCSACIAANCNTEYQNCTDAACEYEFPCIQRCVLAPTCDGGTPASLDSCAQNCIYNNASGTIADTTNALIACISSGDDGGADCSISCLRGAQ